MLRPLPAEAKDHNARIELWRIHPDISKVRVQGHQHAAFSSAHGCDSCIVLTVHPLHPNGDGIVACIDEEPGKFAGEILV